MNVCFLVDNSASMAQKAYNGLTLLELAKNYVQKATEGRPGWTTRYMDTEVSNFHLFHTSSPLPLSGYQHQELHFINQLKYIKPQNVTDLTSTLVSTFKHLNKFRVFFNCDNLLGTVEPFNSYPCLVLIFTDSCDSVTLGSILAKIKGNQLMNQYDCQLNILRICPPCYSDKPSFDAIKKSVENDRVSKTMTQIAQHCNGKYFSIVKYEYGFEVVENLINSFKPRVSIRMEVLEQTKPIPHFKESNIEVEVNSSSSLRGNRSLVLTSLCKGSMRRTKIPLPVHPPKLKSAQSSSSPSIEIEEIFLPSYSVDFSKLLDYPLSENMPFERMELEPHEVLILVQDKLQRAKIQKAYFPISWNFEQRKTLIGLLKVSTSKPAEMLIYLANFTQFNTLFQLMEKKPDGFSLSAFEGAVLEYLRKVPPAYDNYLLQLLFSRSFRVDIPNRIPQHLIKANHQLSSTQYRERKTLSEELAANTISHQTNTSTCCPIYSDFYGKWSQGQGKDRFQSHPFSEARQDIHRILELKKMVLSGVDDDIKLTEFVVKPITRELSNYSNKSLNENESFGNPYKKKKKVDDINIPLDETPQQHHPDGPHHTPPPIQEQSSMQIEPSMPVSPSKTSPSPTRRQLKAKQRPKSEQQLAILRLLEGFQIVKPMEIRINLNNLAMQQHSINLKIIRQNSA